MSSNVPVGSAFVGIVCAMVSSTVRIGEMRQIATAVLEMSFLVVVDCVYHGRRDAMVGETVPMILTRRDVHAVAESSPAQMVHVSPKYIPVMGDLTVLMAQTSETAFVMQISSDVQVGPVLEGGQGVMVAMTVGTCRMRRAVDAHLDSLDVEMVCAYSSLRDVTG